MNTTIELIEMRALVAVVRAGSFTAAADVLDTDKAHVSRIISRLEEKLGAQLLVRSTRRLNVTEIGREVTERASGILAALDDTQALAAKVRREPAGTFRLAAGSEFGMLRVNRWITSFLSRHPSVRVGPSSQTALSTLFTKGSILPFGLDHCPIQNYPHGGSA